MQESKRAKVIAVNPLKTYPEDTPQPDSDNIHAPYDSWPDCRREASVLMSSEGCSRRKSPLPRPSAWASAPWASTVGVRAEKHLATLTVQRYTLCKLQSRHGSCATASPPRLSTSKNFSFFYFVREKSSQVRAEHFH